MAIRLAPLREAASLHPATVPATSSVVDIARRCAHAATSDEVFRSALPLWCELVGAHAALVVRTTVDGPVVDAAAGAPLAVDALPVLQADGAAPSVPTQWASGGIRDIRTDALPGEAGVLITAWTTTATLPPETEDALAVIVSAVARSEAEHRLADLTARVNNAQQLANMGDYDWHIATDTNTWSDQLYRIYGHEPQSFNASYERFLTHIHPDDRERIMAVHQAAYATGEPYQMIERIVRPDGEVRYLSSNGQVVHDDNGTPLRMRGTCIDITDRIQAEQAQEGSSARFRSLVEASPDAIMVLDPAGVVVQANAHASDLVGGDPIGHAFAEIRPPARAGSDTGAQPWDVAGSTSATERSVPAIGLDGRTLTLDLFTAPLSDADDHGLRAVFVRDATDRLAAEAMTATLREVQLRRRQALEINDNVVQGLTAALYSMQLGDTVGCASYLERTLRSARRMMNEWLNPLDGQPVQAGDLVRESASVMDPAQHPVGDIADLGRSSGSRPRVLVVDDNVGMRTLARAQLEMSGRYDVVGEAVDGNEAIEQAETLQPEIVVLDLAMPRMDGLQALPHILAAVPGVHVIVLSGFDQSTMAARALTAGAARYVEKGPAMDLATVIDGLLQAA